MFLRVLVAAALISTSVQADIKTVPSSQAEIKLSYAPLVKEAAPAVVNIYTSKTVRTRSISPLFNDPFFRRFFGDAFRGVPQGGEKKRVQNSLGSGVIVKGNGVVITNHHVIEGADDIKVVLNDRREFEAKLLGSDERTDLAILQIDTEGAILPSLSLGDSDEVEVGDLVLAIGNPFGVGQTVTSGIVSALARTQVGITDYSFFIQTDAAINPGNSGGALVDMHGNLIGVNSAIYSKGGGSNGIGFAIPANMVKSVLSGVSQSGKVVRPWLGASGKAMTQDLASSFKMKRPTGVLIEMIYPDGPADQAGLQRGDIILKMDGYEINDPQALRFRLATKPLGEKMVMDVLRRGKNVNVDFIATAPFEKPAREETKLNGFHPFDGSVIVNLSPAYNDEQGWDTMLRGVAIEKIRRGSTAHRLGFRPGDVITGVNGIEVASVRDLLRVLNDYKGYKGDWRIGIVRNGKRQELRFRG
ncbi:DegQ family serine endoprotease [Terasakiella pusilla]|uniref:DegQ family serine endoprotease n=1 Tax=Terasakiella pusilla TaxID=64973 RepID=UPI0004903998|nr:DegQ family serine endoprotease [Terasakiella pusilla]